MCGHNCPGRYCLNEQTLSEAWPGQEDLSKHCKDSEAHPGCKDSCGSKEKGLDMIPIPSGTNLTKIMSTKHIVAYSQAQGDFRGVRERFVAIGDREEWSKTQPNVIKVAFIPDPHFSTTWDSCREEASYLELDLKVSTLQWIHSLCPSYIHCVNSWEQEKLRSMFGLQSADMLKVRIWGPVSHFQYPLGQIIKDADKI